MKTKTKQRIMVAAGLVAVVGALAGVKASQIFTMVRASESFAPPPEAVASARVETARWEATRAGIGSIVAVRGVTIAAELPGRVRDIGFESGP